jgi:hypothetical protein
MYLVGVVGKITPNPKSNGKERLEVEDCLIFVSFFVPDLTQINPGRMRFKCVC